jgi:hypothetical protein
MRGGRRRTSGQGRPKGVPNKITSDLRAMILGALFDVGGQAYLAEQAQKNPSAFMSLLSKILPSVANVNLTNEPTTEELIAIILSDPQLAAIIGARVETADERLH